MVQGQAIVHAEKSNKAYGYYLTITIHRPIRRSRYDL